MRARSLRIGSPGVSLGSLVGGASRALRLPDRRRASSSATKKNLDAIQRRRSGGDMADYKDWTKLGLIQRIRELEQRLREAPGGGEPPPERDVSAADGGTKSKPRAKRKIDPSRYSTRYIALKLAYLGKDYGGFEFQAEGNQPSIEEELWKALTKTCLIFPEDERVVDFDCCEYSKCGRTDRGVSAFGQVVGLRVRSNRPLRSKRAKLEGADAQQAVDPQQAAAAASSEAAAAAAFDDVRDEIPYASVLNRVLPKDIRILAWCPAPPAGFSARFSCRERQYRYFFTQPAFQPALPGSARESESGTVAPGWLDIGAMRAAAKRFEGEHDFRNLCKIDPAKQITNFRRRIFEADIVEVPEAAGALPYLAPKHLEGQQGQGEAGALPKVYYFHVRGSAFLWHQIRHMVAVLFLVGQGLEPPALVSRLLDVQRTPGRPNYVMADEVPLVLWDCVFPADADAPPPHADALPWVWAGEDAAGRRHGQSGLLDDAWQTWRGHKMDELLAGQLLQKIARQDLDGGGGGGNRTDSVDSNKPGGSVRVFEGGNGGRMAGKYVGVMGMKMLESAEEQNDKYARRKGYADAADMRRQKGIS